MANNNKNTTTALIGRNAEITQMRDLLQTKQSELLAVLGRRRVGKTFLIKNVYKTDLCFYLTGIENSNRSIQLSNFVAARNEYFPLKKKLDKPNNWFEAFEQLKLLMGKTKAKKRVLFFDEFPWLAHHSKEFIAVFDHFWNTWAINQNVIVVICGSAASWIIKNVINQKGGLHNRVTAKIHLKPFTLLETELFLKHKGFNLPRVQVAQLYMVFGGIPFYLNEVKKSKSVVENINQCFFAPNAQLGNEFNNLYKALFKNAHLHLKLVKVLASKWKGLTRKEIIRATKINSGGGLSTVISELEQSDFIQSYIPIGKAERDRLYRLTDELSVFYIHFVQKNIAVTDFWLKQYKSAAALAWQGFAFESLCIRHIDAIKQALGISGIGTRQSSYIQHAIGQRAGFQIDLLIERDDRAINICEMKFYDGAYNITLADANSIRLKADALRFVQRKQLQVFTTYITVAGITSGKNSYLVDQVVTLNSLFV
jgi:uncharacterized protein